MNSATRYLEAEKVEEVASTLRSQGYRVEQGVGDVAHRFDLVAVKGDKKIAVEVRAGPALREADQEIRALRDEAHRRGFSEFRLVVVNPPRTSSIQIDDLEAKLALAMAEDSPGELDSLSTRTTIESVSDLEIESLVIDREGIKVVGSGIVQVRLAYGSTRNGGASMESNFPFRFDVLLDHALRIVEHGRWSVETSIALEGVRAEP